VRRCDSWRLVDSQVEQHHAPLQLRLAQTNGRAHLHGGLVEAGEGLAGGRGLELGRRQVLPHAVAGCAGIASIRMLQG